MLKHEFQELTMQVLDDHVIQPGDLDNQEDRILLSGYDNERSASSYL